MTTFKIIATTTALSLGLGFLPGGASPLSAATIQKTTAPASFTGEIGSRQAREKLFNFFSKYEKKVVTLDVTLSKEQVAELDDVEKGEILYVSLTYKEQADDVHSTGAEVLIHIEKGMKGLTLDRATGKLRGKVRVTEIAGPHQGIMSVNLSPMGK